MGAMKAVQVSKPKGPFEVVERDEAIRGRARSASRWRHAASATAMR